jgi:hypothetical protein
MLEVQLYRHAVSPQINNRNFAFCPLNVAVCGFHANLRTNSDVDTKQVLSIDICNGDALCFL